MNDKHARQMTDAEFEAETEKLLNESRKQMQRRMHPGFFAANAAGRAMSERGEPANMQGWQEVYEEKLAEYGGKSGR